MSCSKCNMEFTQVHRKQITCDVCYQKTCWKCITKDFKTNFESKCQQCLSDFKAVDVISNPRPSLVSQTWKFLEDFEKDDLNPIEKIFSTSARNKLKIVIGRVDALSKHTELFPEDTYMKHLLDQSILRKKSLSKLLHSSDVTICECSGSYSAHNISLFHQALMKISSENLPTFSLPMSLKNHTRDFKHSSLPSVCDKCSKEACYPPTGFTKEKRCPGCFTLIQFYSKYDSLNTICCPKCDLLFSRWANTTISEDRKLTHKGVYRTFFALCGVLVDEDTRS